MDVFFPEETGSDLLVSSALIRQCHAQLDKMLGNTTDQAVKASKEEVLRLTKPENWHPALKPNMIAKINDSFAHLCIVLQRFSNQSIESMSAMQFYQLKRFASDPKNHQ